MGNRLRLGEIKPEGWLKESLLKNMEGCIGHLDELLPKLLVDQEIYGRDRLGKNSKLYDLGRKDGDYHEVEGVDAQYLWWNSESQSNWKDGYCRSACLLDNGDWREKAADFAESILDTQDEDGYLGIYKEELRFQFDTENGELWAQSTLLRMLLGYYETVQDDRILNGAVRAVNRIMEGYPIYRSNPFQVHDSFAGHCHGLTIVDAFNQIYRITGDKKYVEYAVWLYKNYSLHHVSEEDLKICNIENPDYFFKGHGVHTYEHIRALIITAYEEKEYMPLLMMLLSKLPFYLTPSGGPIGDEWIFGRTADASATGYEFCSVQELMDSYLLLMELSGNLSWGDKVEWLYYNAAQGMVHPLESSIMYCKTDNCYEADEHRSPDDGIKNPRYKYSPTHQDAAVCCVPNSGRIVPYFIQSMFLKSEQGFQAVLYGACVMKSTWQKAEVMIKETTDYPFSSKVRLKVTVSQPAEFSLSFRFPEWADQVILNHHIYDKESVREGEIKIHRVWEGTTDFELSFVCRVRFKKDFHGETYISRGPVIYALPIPAKEKTLKELNGGSFYEKAYVPESRIYENAYLMERDFTNFQYCENSEGKDWERCILKGICYTDGVKHRQEFVPMGHTILRKTTFSVKTN